MCCIHFSGAVELSSMMAVQTSHVKTGFKVVSRMHTSTAVKGMVELTSDGGFSFKSKVELPKDNMEIIDIQ